MAAISLSPLREQRYYLVLGSNICVKGDKMKRENNPIRQPLETWCSLSVPQCTASNKGNRNSWCLYFTWILDAHTTTLVSWKLQTIALYTCEVLNPFMFSCFHSLCCGLRLRGSSCSIKKSYWSYDHKFSSPNWVKEQLKFFSAMPAIKLS